MKRIKLLVGFLVALVILGELSAPTVSAQALDGVWLKCKVNVKGYAVDPATGDYSKANGSIPVYLSFSWIPAWNKYSIFVYTNSDGVWGQPTQSIYNTVRPGEHFIPNFNLNIKISSTEYIDTYHTAFFNLKFKDGMLTKVTYKGTGEVSSGKVDGGTRDYYGYFNIRGTSVDKAKVPF